jgi:hypothetical protein
VIEDLLGEGGGVVTGLDRAGGDRHAECHGLGKRDLEGPEPVKTDGRTESHDRRFTHSGRIGEAGHVESDGGRRVAENHRRDLFRVAQLLSAVRDHGEQRRRRYLRHGHDIQDSRARSRADRTREDNRAGTGSWRGPGRRKPPC